MYFIIHDPSVVVSFSRTWVKRVQKDFVSLSTSNRRCWERDFLGSFTDFLHPQSPEKYKHGTFDSPSMQMTAGCLPDTYHTALHEQMINVFMNVKGHAVSNKLKPLTNVLTVWRLSTEEVKYALSHTLRSGFKRQIHYLQSETRRFFQELNRRVTDYT